MSFRLYHCRAFILACVALCRVRHFGLPVSQCIYMESMAFSLYAELYDVNVHCLLLQPWLLNKVVIMSCLFLLLFGDVWFL